MGPITEPDSCKNQLRLIFQPMVMKGGAATTEDSAVLRLLHDGGKRMGPLAQHPIMKAQGLEGPMAKGLNAVVLRYAGAKNFERFTIFSTSGLGTAWNFKGFDVRAGVTSPMAIPTVPQGTTTVAFFRGFAKKTLSGDFTPPTTASDNLQLFANDDLTSAATAQKKQAAFDAALRIENPDIHSPDTIDCASCHAAQPVRTMMGERKLGLSGKGSGNAFAADERSVPAVDLAQTTKPKDDDDVNVHMFSYEDVTASIHQRTINETAAIVSYLIEKRVVAIP